MDQDIRTLSQGLVSQERKREGAGDRLRECEKLAILSLSAQGMTSRAIATSVGCGKSTVNRILKRVRSEGTIANKRSTGRPRKTSERADHFLSLLARRDPLASARELKESAAAAGVHVSVKTIARRLKEKGLMSRIQRTKPLLTPAAARRRLAFAKKYRLMPPSFWRRVIWSDESKFELISNRRRTRVWRTAREAFARRMVKVRVKHSKYVMIWGCFSYSGVGKLVVIRDKLTADKFIDIINDNLLPSACDMGIQSDFLLQLDNDPKHTAKATKAYFEEVGLETLEWPSYSADLNPIEHLWDQLDRDIPQDKRRRLQTFVEAMQEAWDNMPAARLEALVDSVPSRLEAVIAAKGYHTRY